jgi:tetratricopeptide (TPR) repeat protein
VSLDDGTQLTEPASLQTICRGQRHTVAYTDSHGSFSFQFADLSPGANSDFTDAGNSMMTRSEGLRDRRSWQDCELQAVLAGFTSEVIELTSRMSSMESTDIGRVVLHRMAHVEGTSISVTSALAPKPAQKALQKAYDAEKRGHWPQAEQSLQKAVQIYPKYAVAWNELGRVQLRRNDMASATTSFQQSVKADPKYVNPYDGLSLIAFQARQWPSVVETTNQLIALNPVNFPNAYFLNGVANYYLTNMDAAERSVRQGIKVDDAHQVPRLQFVLGMILLRKQDYREASEHLEQYLALPTRPPTQHKRSERPGALFRPSQTLIPGASALTHFSCCNKS